MRMLRHKHSRHWAVLDNQGRLVCVCVYRKGAVEVCRRLRPHEPVLLRRYGNKTHQRFPARQENAL